MTVRLRVRVHPGARRDRIAGRLADGTLKLDVAAAPEAGRANEGVVRLLAEVLNVARGRVRIARGPASRDKQVEIDGMNEIDVTRAIEAALPPALGARETRRGD